jgi:hypothetical protein
MSSRGLSSSTTFPRPFRPFVWRDPRVWVSLIMCTGGAYRPLRHDRHFSTASSHIGVSRGRRMHSRLGSR